MFLIKLDGFKADVVEYRDGVLVHFDEEGFATHAEELPEGQVIEDGRLIPLASSVAEELDDIARNVLVKVANDAD